MDFRTIIDTDVIPVRPEQKVNVSSISLLSDSVFGARAGFERMSGAELVVKLLDDWAISAAF